MKKKIKTHNVKTWVEFKKDILSGEKRFEVRKDDRNYKVGDFIRHQFWNPNTKQYEGGEALALITYKLNGGQFGIQGGFCVLGTSEIVLA